jgi:FhaA, N-terminal domain/FHA domain
VGVLDRFEKGIERAVNGVFARAFRSEVQPVELASALKREADDNASVVGRNRTIAPNHYVVELGPADHRRLAQWEDALGEELSTVLNDHALQQRYAFVGPVRVSFERAEDLDTGVFRVRSRTARDGDHADHGQSGHADRASRTPAPAYPSSYPEAGRSGSAAGSGFPSSPYAPTPYAGSSQPAPAPWESAPAPTPGSPYAARQPERPQQAPLVEIDGRRIPLSRPVSVVGRAGDVDLPLDDAGVSRRHAEIHVTDAGARVVDLGSTNGTFVDGERVTSGELHDGSTITVGRSRLVFRRVNR